MDFKSYYKKDDPTKVVQIMDDKKGFYELSDGHMIKKDVFLKYYIPMDIPVMNESHTYKQNSDVINPDSFFKSSTIINQDDIIKLKNADPSKGAYENSDRTEIIVNTTNKTRNSVPVVNESHKQNVMTMPSNNESLVREVDEKSIPIPNNTNTDVSMYKVYDDEDEAYNDLMNKGNNTAQQPIVHKPQYNPELDQLYEDEKLAYGIEEANRRRDVRLKRTQEVKPIEQPQPKLETKTQDIVMNPSEMMFKTFKRNYNIKINVEFSDKIANPEFIKIMMENMDGDIIGFYKKLILENITKNFKIVEDAVETQLKNVIFGEIVEEKDIPNDKIVYTKSVLNNTESDLQVEPEIVKDEDGNILIPGGKTAAGKQLYKYVDERGRVREVLPNKAKSNGWKPYKE